MLEFPYPNGLKDYAYNTEREVFESSAAILLGDEGTLPGVVYRKNRS
jgi:hypothetical protein